MKVKSSTPGWQPAVESGGEGEEGRGGGDFYGILAKDVALVFLYKIIT